MHAHTNMSVFESQELQDVLKDDTFQVQHERMALNPLPRQIESLPSKSKVVRDEFR